MIVIINRYGEKILVLRCFNWFYLQVLDKCTLYNTFSKLFRENIKYEVVKAVVNDMFNSSKEEKDESNNVIPNNKSQSPEKVGGKVTLDNNTLNMLKEKIIAEKSRSPEKVSDKKEGNSAITLLKEKINDMLPQTAIKENEKKVSEKLIVRGHATWDTFFKDKPKVTFSAIFTAEENSEKEYFIFSSSPSAFENIPKDSYLSFDKLDDDKEIIEAELENGNHQTLRKIKTLSSLEQYFFLMSSQESGESNLLVGSDLLTNLFIQFETKHKSKIMVVNKLEQENPYVFCSVEPVETWKRIDAIEEMKKIREDESEDEEEIDTVKLNLVRKHHNPDEIIDGRPKWSEMKVIHSKSKDDDLSKKEEHFDFDRLNPHRTFIPEFEDEFDNTDWVYNHTVLKMMADLNSETAVVLGNTRLDAEKDKKYMEEYQEWQKYKRENKHTYPHVRLKKLKADKMVKIKQFKIIAKNLRKNSIYV